jgi:hypothetical protein
MNMNKAIALTLVCLLESTANAAHAQDATQPPAGAAVRYTVVGLGLQIYACKADGKWVLQEPKADLIDLQTKQAVGTHTKGPTWTWNDGSAVTGKVLQQQPSANTIPWLLLEAHAAGTAGALSDIAFVRRSDTQGGLPQAVNICGMNNVDSIISVPYQATYTFYTAK